MKGDPQGYTERLKQFVDGQQIALEYDSKIAPARGVSSGGKITLLPDLAFAEHFAVLIHEVAQELLHRGDSHSEDPQFSTVVLPMIGSDCGIARPLLDAEQRMNARR